MMLAAAALLMMTAPVAGQDAQHHSDVSQAIERCGVAPADYGADYVEALEETVFVFSSASYDADRIACLVVVSLDSDGEFYFEDATVSRLFAEEYARQSAAAAHRMARAWLAERDMLNSLPSYDPAHDSLADFAERMEAFCKLERRGTLIARDGYLTLDLDVMQRDSASEDEMTCLVNAIFESDFGKSGGMFGFVGNEADIPGGEDAAPVTNP
ncbi:hypothetical protein [Stakelama tenebrarum]|uniref:Uncharacterized protein n=1 Tax=Stakelama tenebrarum TaxID=2711215 RepID=A0A6G6Y2R9_9SPHN|nr:hypothetical protein [Sphingosinithalassobacter tenebrarum]QIG79222.1 hypothetical protein G5C33_05060 [Sphingosinithalassobacter tenebrarum]